MTDNDIDQLKALLHNSIERRKELERTVTEQADRIAAIEQRIETLEMYLDEIEQ